jgi:hypothetical protein
MKYSLWDILILYCISLIGMFAALEIIIFLLFWGFIICQRNLDFIPLMVRYYTALQHINNPGTAISFLCLAVSLIRYRRARREQELPAEMLCGLRRMTRNLLILSLVCAILSLIHLITWRLWPWVYW